MDGPQLRVAGIPIRVDPTFLFIAALMGWGARSGALLVAWVIVVVVSILVHELGHAFAFRIYGQQPSIVLQGMGGATSGSGPLSPARDIVVSLAGPAAALLLVGLPALLFDRADMVSSPDWNVVVNDIVFVNIAWSVLNLLPVLPLDGGRVSAALLNIATGGRGTRPAHLVSAVVAAGGAVAALAWGYPFGALFAGFFCAYNLSQLKERGEVAVDRSLVDGYRALLGGDQAEARRTAEVRLSGDTAPDVRAAAQELNAWARLYAAGDGTGGAADAEAALADLPPDTRRNPLMAGAAALAAGDVDEGLAKLEDGFRFRRSGFHGPLAARLAAQHGVADKLADRLLATGRTGIESLEVFVSHLHTAGCFEEAAALGERVLIAGSPDPARTAYNMSCSWARADHVDAALAGLERAVEYGFDDVELLDSDPDWAEMRDADGFKALRARLVLPAAPKEAGR